MFMEYKLYIKQMCDVAIFIYIACGVQKII